MPGALSVRVFVFWAGRKGLCFVFLCFGLAQRACVLCFRVLADPPQNTGGRQSGVPRLERGLPLLLLSPVGLALWRGRHVRSRIPVFNAVSRGRRPPGVDHVWRQNHEGCLTLRWTIESAADPLGAAPARLDEQWM